MAAPVWLPQPSTAQRAALHSHVLPRAVLHCAAASCGLRCFTCRLVSAACMAASAVFAEPISSSMPRLSACAASFSARKRSTSCMHAGGRVHECKHAGWSQDRTGTAAVTTACMHGTPGKHQQLAVRTLLPSPPLPLPGPARPGVCHQPLPCRLHHTTIHHTTPHHATTAAGSRRTVRGSPCSAHAPPQVALPARAARPAPRPAACWPPPAPPQPPCARAPSPPSPPARRRGRTPPRTCGCTHGRP